MCDCSETVARIKLLLSFYRTNYHSVTLALYIDNRYLTGEQSDFVQLVTADIAAFLQNTAIDKNRVLVFPPVLSGYRFLIHKTVEAFPTLCSFSIGEEESRRNVICHKETIFRSFMMEQGVGAVPLPPAPTEKPENSPQQSTSRSKGRKPDRQVYVPKGRRSDMSSADSAELPTTSENPSDSAAASQADIEKSPPEKTSRKSHVRGKEKGERVKGEGKKSKSSSYRRTEERKARESGENMSCDRGEGRVMASGEAGDGETSKQSESSERLKGIEDRTDTGKVVEDGSSKVRDVSSSSVTVVNKELSNDMTSCFKGYVAGEDIEEGSDDANKLENSEQLQLNELESMKQLLTNQLQEIESDELATNHTAANNSCPESSTNEVAGSSSCTEQSTNETARINSCLETSTNQAALPITSQEQPTNQTSGINSSQELSTNQVAGISSSQDPSANQHKEPESGQSCDVDVASIEFNLRALRDGSSTSRTNLGEAKVATHGDKSDKPNNDDDDDDDDDDDWEKRFDDKGDSITSELLDEITCAVGNVEVDKPQFDYYNYQPRDPDISENDYGHLIEIYEFPVSLVTRDLLMAFQQFHASGFDVKWVDDTHAIGVFSGHIAACSALQDFYHPLMKVRPITQASRQTKVKVKRCSEFLLPYKARPATVASVARNLVAGALGLQTRVSREKRAEEREKLRDAKMRKTTAQRDREAAWDGTLGAAMDT